MSDDFNKDDDFPSWLQDDDQDLPEEDFSPDWLQDDESGDSSQQSPQPGVTGDLPWLQDEDQPAAGTDRPAGRGMTGELPWMQDDEALPTGQDRPAGRGMTGELPWMQDNSEQDDDAPDSDVDPLDWMMQEDSLEDSEVLPQDADDLPAWLADEEPQADADLPPWLEDADEVEEPAAELLSEDWLAQAEELPDTAETELSYDEWMEQQEAASRPPDLDKEIPDWMQSIQDQPPTGDLLEPVDLGTGDLPSWYLGMEELDTSDAPDWFTGSDEGQVPQPEADLEQAEVPDWMQLEGETSEEAADFEDTEPEQFGQLDDDFFRAMGLNLGTEEVGGEEEEFEPERQAEDDFLSALRFTDTQEESPAASDEDILRSLGIFDDEPQPAAQQSGDDFLRSLGISDEPDADQEFLAEEVPSDQGDDFFRSFGGDESEEQAAPDWFGEEEQVVSETPDWLQQLGEEDLSTFFSGEEPEIEPAEEDFLPQTGSREQAFNQQAESAFQFEDIDALLASMDTGVKDLPDTGNLLDEDVDFDRLLEGQAAFEEPEKPDEKSLGAAIPSWLTDLGASVGEVSAGAIVRQRKDRPLEDLSERLQKLHDKTENLLADTGIADAGALANVLPGVTEALPPSPIKPGLPGITGQVILSGDQQNKVNLLKSLIAADADGPGPARPSAIDLTYDTPYMDLGLEDEEPDLEAESKPQMEAQPVAKPRIRPRYKIDRLLIAIIVALAVILPFLPQLGALRIGSLPPAQFVPGSRQQVAFDQVNALNAEDAVLVAIEYGPTGAAELDSMTEAIVRHIFARGGRPVLVSGNPVGLLHAGNVVDSLGADADFLESTDRTRAFEANRDYYVVRYLAGSTIGLRAFSQNTAELLLTDIRGQATGLNITSLNDFALIVIVSERAEDVRAWAEQIAPLTTAPMFAAVSYSASPLAEPYTSANLQGLLVGYRDAYTYNTLLGGPLPPVIQIPPTTPPPTPTEIETTESPAVIATEEATATQESTTIPTTAAPTATGTLQPTATTVSSSTPQPTATPSLTATNIPTATETIVPVIAVVQASQAINMRSGPGQNFERITTVEPNTEVMVIGRNADGSWVNVRLEDGTEGWIASQLLDLRGRPTDAPGAPTPTPEQISGLVVVMADSDVGLGALFAQPATEEATAEVTEDVTVVPTLTPRPTAALDSNVQTADYRDERWYGMTLGILVSVVVITLGALANIVRAVFRRGRK